MGDMLRAYGQSDGKTISFKIDEPSDGNPHEGLYESNDAACAARRLRKVIMESSLYTNAILHPMLTGALVALGAG